MAWVARQFQTVWDDVYMVKAPGCLGGMVPGSAKKTDQGLYMGVYLRIYGSTIKRRI